MVLGHQIVLFKLSSEVYFLPVQYCKVKAVVYTEIFAVKVTMLLRSSRLITQIVRRVLSLAKSVQGKYNVRFHYFLLCANYVNCDVIVKMTQTWFLATKLYYLNYPLGFIFYQTNIAKL